MNDQYKELLREYFKAREQFVVYKIYEIEDRLKQAIGWWEDKAKEKR